MMENVIIVIIYLKKERVMIMSKSIFVSLTNEILKDLGYKMLTVEFNDDLIANVKYTKDGSIVNNFFVAFRYVQLGNLRNKILSEVM